jgi:uncharacterized protein YdiU (UPF0061 family)
MRRKLGLIGEDTGDAALSDDLMTAMTGADWTLTFRRLADEPVCAPVRRFHARWRLGCPAGKPAQATAPPTASPVTNPAVIPRNHKVEAA